MSNYTHEIVRIERGTTKGSSSPMWRCTTQDGQTVNVFKHALPERNTFELMLQAGYAAFSQMETGEVQRWKTYPIKVQLVKDGDWWKLAAVEPRPVHAEADVDYVPDVALYKNRAQRTAILLMLEREGIQYIDTERTGLNDDDEIVAMSMIRPGGAVGFDSLIRPHHPEKLLRPGKNGKTASEVNGITPDMLTDAMPIINALDEFAAHLNGAVIVAYNAPFDMRAIEMDCVANHHTLIVPFAVHDAMQIVAEYIGDWQPKTQNFKPVTLSKAAHLLDLDPGQTHTAKADALATLEIMKAIAAGKPIKSEFGAFAE
jgi:DNA polymerase-3 subunit epsilon